MLGALLFTIGCAWYCYITYMCWLPVYKKADEKFSCILVLLFRLSPAIIIPILMFSGALGE